MEIEWNMSGIGHGKAIKKWKAWTFSRLKETYRAQSSVIFLNNYWIALDRLVSRALKLRDLWNTLSLSRSLPSNKQHTKVASCDEGKNSSVICEKCFFFSRSVHSYFSLDFRVSHTKSSHLMVLLVLCGSRHPSVRAHSERAALKLDSGINRPTENSCDRWSVRFRGWFILNRVYTVCARFFFARAAFFTHL